MPIPSDFMVIAHRGASSYAPENTLAAFDLAVEMGARHVELDVHETRDGRVVVLHDATLDRTTDGAGPVAERDWAEVRALDAGAWFGPQFSGQRVPAFEEVLERYRGMLRLHVEIKGRSEGLVRKSLDMIRRCGMGGEATLTSFQRERIEEARAMGPEMPAGLLAREMDAGTVAWAKAAGLAMLCPRAEWLTPERVAELHGQGFLVRAYGVPDVQAMERVLDSGADGMTVNFPDKALALLRERGGGWGCQPTLPRS